LLVPEICKPTTEALVMVIPMLICLLGMNVKNTDALKAWIVCSVSGWHSQWGQSFTWGCDEAG